MTNTQVIALADSYSNSNVILVSQIKTKSQNLDLKSYSTIDGEVVNFSEGCQAVNSGSGIFIGSYFVGNSDCYEHMNNVPFVRY